MMPLTALAVTGSLAMQPVKTGFQPPYSGVPGSEYAETSGRSLGDSNRLTLTTFGPTSAFNSGVILLQAHAVPNGTRTLNSLAGKIESFFTLQAGWDSEGSAAPSREAIHEALEFLSILPSDLPLPRAMALPSGDVALYWEYDDIYAEIGFSGTRAFYAYVDVPGQAPLHIDDGSLLSDDGQLSFPENIRAMLLSGSCTA